LARDILAGDNIVKRHFGKRHFVAGHFVAGHFVAGHFVARQFTVVPTFSISRTSRKKDFYVWTLIGHLRDKAYLGKKRQHDAKRPPKCCRR
jgi:hypothetical protein